MMDIVNYMNKLQSYTFTARMFSRWVCNHSKMIIWLTVESLTDACKNCTTIMLYDEVKIQGLRYNLMRIKILS